MEENKQYYVPDRESLYIGYCCEILNAADAQQRWATITIDQQFLPIALRISERGIRTKYLDKADIESLHWKWDEDKDYGQKFYQEVGDKYWILHTEWGDTNVTIVEYREKLEGPNRWITKFDGECKSINELKKLMRWLNIQKEEI